MAGDLLWKHSLAAAVAREIVGGGRDGLAYKAQFQRQAEKAQRRVDLAMQLCDDAARDGQLMNELVAAKTVRP